MKPTCCETAVIHTKIQTQQEKKQHRGLSETGMASRITASVTWGFSYCISEITLNQGNNLNFFYLKFFLNQVGAKLLYKYAILKIELHTSIINTGIKKFKFNEVKIKYIFILNT